jgi:SAM-dependent methyltransferase
MTDEATKTRTARGEVFARKYLSGRIIDIGCGPDPIAPHAEPFDLEHGDAQCIAEVRANGEYDAVCSSHCLEHMRNVPEALSQWWRLVKPGGHLIVVVPDENLYEQGTWPSLFNWDHKATFRLGGEASWCPVSYDIRRLVSELHDAEIISCDLQDHNYDYSRRQSRIGGIGRVLFRSKYLFHSLFARLGKPGRRVAALVDLLFDHLGAPVDQTAGPALAQIQVIARKRN